MIHMIARTHFVIRHLSITLTFGVCVHLPFVVSSHAQETPNSSTAQQTDKVSSPKIDAPINTKKAHTHQTQSKSEAIASTHSHKASAQGILLSSNSESKHAWQLRMSGYVRTQFNNIEDDPLILFSGRNDGFLLANGRVSFDGILKNGLGFRLQLELASNLNVQSNVTPFRENVLRSRDAFISYTPFDWIEARVGQFRAPFDLEALLPISQLNFANRSVGSRGVSTQEARENLTGLSIDRQIGLMLTGSYHLGSSYNAQGRVAQNPKKGLGFSYSAAITNGFDALKTFNDNDSYAYYTRLAVHWADIVSLGGAFFYNDTSIAIDSEGAQDIIPQSDVGFTGDLQINILGASFFTHYIERQQTLQTSTPISVFARSYQAQLAYLIPVANIQPAYRFAYYDPTAEYTTTEDEPVGQSARTVDAITQHTLGISYIDPQYPFTFRFNYTIANEQEGHKINNNRLDILFQLTF